ncbi:hypothetical protein GVAV_001996 [Gurleya vavrai]
MQIQEQIDNRQGTSQVLSNIKLLTHLSSYLKTTLGPYGLDKLIVTNNTQIITNDGATIMKSLNFNHPAAKLMKSISIAQDDEVGDGTTSVVLFTVEILKSLEEIIRKGGVDNVIKSIDKILNICINKLEENSIKIISNKNEETIKNPSIDNSQNKENVKNKINDYTENIKNNASNTNNSQKNNNIDNTKSESIFNNEEDFIEERNNFLKKLAKTALTSKVVKYEKEFFSNLIVNGLSENKKLAIKKIKGGSFKDSFLFEGVAFEKCFTYAGYEQQPKLIKNPKVLLTNVELEWKSERENAEMRIKNVDEYQNVVNAEWKIIKDKLDFIVKSGAKVVLSKLAIGDYATQYFARFGIFCAGRVNSSDINKIKECSKAQILSSLADRNIDFEKVLGEFDLFEEKQIGNLRYNFLHLKKTATIVLRGPGDEILNEMERSLNDANMIVKKNMKESLEIITGGGSNEMQISIELKKKGSEFDTEKMFIYFAISHALENYISILSSNFGMDSIETITNLRVVHKEGKKSFGVVNNRNLVGDMIEAGVFEPLSVKKNIFINAFNAVKTILMIDSTIMVPNK